MSNSSDMLWSAISCLELLNSALDPLLPADLVVPLYSPRVQKYTSGGKVNVFEQGIRHG